MSHVTCQSKDETGLARQIKPHVQAERSFARPRGGAMPKGGGPFARRRGRNDDVNQMSYDDELKAQIAADVAAARACLKA